MLAAVVLTGAAALQIGLAGPAAAAGSVTVTPSTGLTDGQVVTVSGSGLPSGQLAVTQCGNATASGTPLPGSAPVAADCHGAGQLGSGGVVLVSGPSFTTPYTVHTSGIGDQGRTCISAADANFPCRIVVGTLSGDILATATISFGDDAPPPPGDDLPPPADTSRYCANADPTTFSDVTYNEDDISCLQATGIAKGYEDGTFRPGLAVRRDQMASFLVRLGESLGSTVADVPPYDGSNQFTDVDPANPHLEAINQLAEMGVTTGITATTYNPSGPVTRAQMATFVNRLHEFLTGDTFDAAGKNYFSDDNASPHEDNINAVASVGIAQGTGEGVYSPQKSVTRSQMASFLVRYLAVLEANGTIEPLQPSF
jgi:hypothetical protein